MEGKCIIKSPKKAGTIPKSVIRAVVRKVKKEEKQAVMLCRYCNKEIAKGEAEIENGKTFHAICLSAIRRL